MAIDVSKLEAQIPELMRRADVPGLSVALIENATVIWNKGFGVKDVRTGEPVDEQTIFAAASLSKPHFACAVLRLCKQYILQLDTPLIEYVSDPLAASGLTQDSLFLEQITARHVLSHVSGMGNWSETNQGKISFKPGERFQYSGEGFN